MPDKMACRVLTDDYICCKLFIAVPETNLIKNTLSDENIFPLTLS